MLPKGLSLFSLIKVVAQLTRLPNVLMIILTQLLLRYCILLPFLYRDAPGSISPLPDFLILVFITVLITAGGNVIKDYFDVKIDSINRPGKLVVNKWISGHSAIKLHLILNVIAILSGFYLAWRVKAISLGFIFPFISGLLWIYSAKYKRSPLVGNIMVAGLSALVILMVWLFEFFWMRLNSLLFIDVLTDIHWVTFIFIAYAAFAFLVSLIREIIKDMEDIKGDETVGSTTLPLVVGIKYTRFIVMAILFITIILLGYFQIVLYRLNLQLVFWYFLVTVQFGAIYLLVKLFFVHDKKGYHHLSNICKLIMLAGILSMGIILINN